jgi:hypothetical protein
MTLTANFGRGVQYSKNWTAGRPSPSAWGTQLTASSTSHTLGTKTDLFASTSHDTYWVRITIQNISLGATQTDALVNVYVGAASSEQVLIPNLLAGWANALQNQTGAPRCYEFPLFIPAGTRVSAALQGLISSETVRVVMELYGGGEPFGWAGRGVECLGADTASSRGTTVTVGAAAEGSFADIGTTSREWRYILPMAQGSLTDTNMGGVYTALDVGVGGALYKDLEEFWIATYVAEFTSPISGGRGRYCVIPSGTALQLRGQCSGTADDLDCCIYGVY